MNKDEETQSRSDITRDRMIRAGLELFGFHGFDGTTTRMVAEKAEVNVAAIPYHFGGKEGLYLAVAEHIGEMIFKNAQDCVIRARELVDSGSKDRQKALDIMFTILNRLANLAVGSELGSVIGPILTREQMHPTKAFDIIYDHYMERLHQSLTAVMAIVIGKRAEEEETILQAHALIGQIVVFRAGREVALRRLKWTTVGPEELNVIKRTVFLMIQKQLGAEDLTIPEEVFQ
jgi:TetR/AcrR family transcriptional regulator, regulator of cefoperazone and chloramphenicol sensitivity